MVNIYHAELVRVTHSHDAVRISNMPFSHYGLMEKDVLSDPHIHKSAKIHNVPYRPLKLVASRNIIVYDVVSLCEYLLACNKPGVPKEDVAHLHERKIKKLHQILTLIINGRHQLHHSNADTEKAQRCVVS